MNKIEKLFSDKKGNKLSVYFTAGFPELNDTAPIMQFLQEAGADLIEVGIPFSDPIADGPTIQSSNKKALENGISLKLILDQVKSASDRLNIPVILMGYLNPIYQYGISKFCEDAASSGVSGVIIPDLPMQEYIREYKQIFETHGLVNTFLVTPQTSEQRIREIDNNTRGFIYMVSASSTTGAKSGLLDEQVRYFSRVRDMKLKNPRLIGFGISDRSSYLTACEYADGAIIGSAFISVLENSKNLNKDITGYIKAIKDKK
jgi:tryptophan synthase alpha chain